MNAYTDKQELKKNIFKIGIRMKTVVLQNIQANNLHIRK